MTFPEPDVDYRATSHRATWADLPDGAVGALEEALGARVRAADAPVTMGFSPAYAGRVALDDGRSVFVKGAPASTPAGDAVGRERCVLAALPPGAPAPGLLAGVEHDGWQVEAVEHVPGHTPGLPWTPPEVTAVERSLLRLARVRADMLPADLVPGELATSLGEDDDVLATATALADGTFASPPWLPHRAHHEDVGALALEARSLLRGDSLLHSDLRPDNLLVRTDGEVVLVDWNWLERGPAWTDLVGLLPLMAEDGIDTAALEARSPLLRDADPRAVDSFLAVVAAYMLSDLLEPPFPGTLPEMRRHQALMARVFVAYLGRRRGW